MKEKRTKCKNLVVLLRPGPFLARPMQQLRMHQSKQIWDAKGCFAFCTHASDSPVHTNTNLRCASSLISSLPLCRLGEFSLHKRLSAFFNVTPVAEYNQRLSFLVQIQTQTSTVIFAFKSRILGILNRRGALLSAICSPCYKNRCLPCV